MAVDVKKIVSDCNKAWNLHDVNKILEFYTNDCLFEDVALGAVCRGKEELAAFLNSNHDFQHDVKFELKSVFGAGDWAGSESIFSGTHAHAIAGIPATGKTFSVRAAGIYQLHNGKISRETGYFNMATIMQQLGLMPGQPK